MITMPLRPIDAIFIHPKKRQYVVYYRGELWQLPRMKIDACAWQRRQPYLNATNELYLSRKQAICDPTLAQHLRTLHLPDALRGSSLPRFEAWWRVHGFTWLKAHLDEGISPLAAHHETLPMPQQTRSTPAITQQKSNHPTLKALIKSDSNNQQESTDVFSGMLATLADEVRHHYDQDCL